MVKVIVVYDNPKQIVELSKYDNIQFIDIMTSKGKKEGWRVKSHWGAKLDPFAIVSNNEDKPVKAFYSEAEDVICSLIKYLEENENSKSN